MHNAQIDNPPPYNVAIRISPPNVPQPPPPYSAVITEVPATNLVVVGHQQAPINDDNNLSQILRELWKRWTTHKISMIVAPCFILLSSISFAALIIGGAKRWNCPDNPEVPAWLIVFGVMGIIWCWSMAFLVRNFYKYCTKTPSSKDASQTKKPLYQITGRAISDESHRKWYKLLLVLTVLLFFAFFFVWSIIGYHWVSNVRTGKNMKCDQTVYNFAYGLSVAQLFIIFVSLCCICGGG